MSGLPDDDLFQDSSMTFGEHLEELRGALFRASIGLAIALCLAFFVADDVINWVESPLRKGLRAFYLKKAKSRLATDFGEQATLEDWAILEQLNWAPQVIRVSRAELSRAVGGSSDEATDDWRVPELAEDSAAKIGKTLRRASKKPKKPAGIAWSLLSPQQQAALLAENDHDSELVTDALNALIDHPSFHTAIFDGAIEACDDPDQRMILERSFANVQTDEDVAARRALNRQLLQLIFPALDTHEPELVQLVTWAPLDISVQALSVHEPFMIFLKAAFVVAFVLASPWVFYQIWLFVAAGLYPHEKQMVYTFLPFSIGLFLLGASLAFFFVFDPVLDFLFGFNLLINVNAEPRISDWISFVLLLPLGFGISFQLPLVMLFLERIGVFTVESYLSQWRIAVLAIFVLSMFLTPADPISMILMAAPLTILFFGGVWLCKRFPRASTPRG